ncbi:MAG: hypothetical protein KA006_01965, partial [Neisseria sp.]|nr:hypothetical protein [Neisseria sp.]
MIVLNITLYREWIIFRNVRGRQSVALHWAPAIADATDIRFCKDFRPSESKFQTAFLLMTLPISIDNVFAVAFQNFFDVQHGFFRRR